MVERDDRRPTDQRKRHPVGGIDRRVRNAVHESEIDVVQVLDTHLLQRPADPLRLLGRHVPVTRVEDRALNRQAEVPANTIEQCPGILEAELYA